MDNILINLDDGIRLGGSELPNVSEQTDIISQSDTLVGPPGPPGPQGPAGSDGQAATITVGTTTTGSAGTNAQVQNSGTSSAAVLDFTIPRGATGADGQAATITVGSTTTGAPGSNASVVNSGDEQDAILDFTIPTGATGSAATITVGSVTSVDYEYPATVTNSGTTSAAVLDFEIPRGVPGETGPAGRDGVDGSDGQAATITVGSTTTGAAGTNASVTNSGTSSAAVLDFTIPRGADGVDGVDGSDGQAATITVGSTTTLPAGSSATVTNSGTTSAAVLNFGIPQGPQGPSGTSGVTETHSGNHYCWKYDDGRMICWGQYSGTLSINQTYENAYFASTGTIAFADTFIAEPYVVVTPLNNSSLLSVNVTSANTTGFGTYVWKTQAKSNVAVKLSYVAYGHWK